MVRVVVATRHPSGERDWLHSRTDSDTDGAGVSGGAGGGGGEGVEGEGGEDGEEGGEDGGGGEGGAGAGCELPTPPRSNCDEEFEDTGEDGGGIGGARGGGGAGKGFSAISSWGWTAAGLSVVSGAICGRATNSACARTSASEGDGEGGRLALAPPAGGASASTGGASPSTSVNVTELPYIVVANPKATSLKRSAFFVSQERFLS